ncbi:tigger transposable element-derived protein 4-like [Nematostella vectensis]|uniref:tigger transposable element-derived protein 4-like n=1 Tax=Nematostella vectensis TaxID=45351 RepID=UPI00138FF82D|nr:tigger transposable element-derived protein 4-like [Nematostella vectensis]
MVSGKILQNKETILASYENSNGHSKLKRIRTGKYANVNDAVWDWYQMCRNSNIPISGTMIQEEAMIIAERLGLNEFTGSNGWLEKFKRQHNIGQMAVSGEEAGVNPETVERWKERAREITRGWDAKNVWNVDETGCLWRGLPEKSLNERGMRLWREKVKTKEHLGILC